MTNNQRILVMFLGMAVVVFVGALSLSFAENVTISNDVQSPKQQLDSGVSPKDVQCREDLVLVLRDNQKIACVKETTAEKKGWDLVDDTANFISLGDTDHNDDDTLNQKRDNFINTVSTETKISTETVTLVSKEYSQYQTESASRPILEDPRYPTPWTTLTYPKEFRVGEPFTINYTWTFLKYYSEAKGDEWPQDDFDKYPWAQVWQPYQEGDDENGYEWWTIKRGDEYSEGFIVRMEGPEGIQVLSEGFEPTSLKFPNMIRDPEYFDKIVINPYDLEEHSESMILQFDEPVYPQDHGYSIEFGIYDDRQIHVLFFHFNESKGYINESGIMWFPSTNPQHAEILAREDLLNPHPCLGNEYWNNRTDDEKRFSLLYPSGYSCPAPKPQLLPVNMTDYNIRSADLFKQVLDLYNVTENFREFFEEVGLDSMEIENFFEHYPHLDGMFILPSFSLLPESFAEHSTGSHLIMGVNNIHQESYKIIITLVSDLDNK